MKRLSLIIVMMLFVAGATFAQRTITGTVTDEGGEALIGANVVVKGTTVGASTDVDGKYSISVPDGSTTLVFSYTGFENKEMEIGASNTLDVTMEEGITLDNVVVTALGVQRDEKAVGYAVQKVDGEAIEKAATPNVVDALRGKAAGVNIIRSSGTVGGGSRIVIRGQTSLIGNNQPLFIVDGVRIDNSSLGSEGATAGVARGNRAMDINPADIESVNVLKGAAATALYGLDGAQGVVIITTKKGKSSKGLNVTVNTSAAFDNVTNMPALQNKYAQGWGGAYFAPETGLSTSWGPEISTLSWDGATDYEYDPNGRIVDNSDPSAQRAVTPYDNINNFFQTGQSYTNTVSVDGGSDKATFRASFSNHTSEGIVPNNTYDRNTVTLGSSLKITDELSVNFNANYTRSDYQRVQQGSNTSGLMLGLLRTPSTFDNAGGFADPVNTQLAYEFADGRQRNYRGGGGYDNPFWTVNNTLRDEKVDRVFGNLSIDYKAHQWFNISAKFGTDLFSDVRTQRFELNSRTAPGGRIFHDDYTMNIRDFYLNFTGSGQLNDDLQFDYLVGGNMFQRYLVNNYVEGNGLAIQDFVHITNASSVTGDNLINRRKTAGIYANANFGYKNMLYLSLTARQDWVSTLINPAVAFNAGDIGFFYPSANLGFVFSELMNNDDILSFGKVRASYAEVGGGAPLAYVTSTVFVPPTPGDGWADDLQFPFLGQSGFVQSNTLGNPNLVPEKTSTVEFGVDLRFFKGKLGLDVTYYDRTSENLIVNASLPASSGYTSAFLNTGKMVANGLEIILSATPVRTDNFVWNTQVNFDRNRTTVEELGPGLERLQIGGFTGTGTFLVAGQPYAQLFGGAYLRTGAGGANDDGLTIPSGDIVINDTPNDPEMGFQIPDPVLRVLGNPNPDFTLGWNNNFSIGPVNFSFLLDVREGGQMWNGTAWALTFFGRSQFTADTREEAPTAITGVKQSDGSANDIAITRGQDYWTSSVGGFGSVDEQFVQETSWIRLREVSVGVDIDPSWLGLENAVQSASFNVSGRNLWFDTPYEGVDPETSLEGNGNAQGFDYFNMPSTRSVIIGLNIRF